MGPGHTGFVHPPPPQLPAQALPGGAGAAVPAGGAEAPAGGTGREKDLLDLGRGGHFPSSGSGLASNPLGIPEPPSSCFLPSWGAFACVYVCLCVCGVSLRPDWNGSDAFAAGRCLFGARSCILSWRLLAEEVSDESRAVEQVVPDVGRGKPVVSPPKVVVRYEMGLYPDQSALIQTYRMRTRRSLEFPGELGQAGSGLYPL